MKLSAAIAIALIGVTSAPALAGGPRFRGRTNTYHEEFCYRYTEEYVPGYYNKHGRYVGGYVKSRKKKFLAGVSIDHHIQIDMKIQHLMLVVV